MFVCTFRALAFECLDLKTSLLAAGTSPEHLRQRRISRSWGQGQGHISVTKYTLAGSPAWTEMPSCFINFQFGRKR